MQSVIDTDMGGGVGGVGGVVAAGGTALWATCLATEAGPCCALRACPDSALIVHLTTTAAAAVR